MGMHPIRINESLGRGNIHIFNNFIEDHRNSLLYIRDTYPEQIYFYSNIYYKASIIHESIKSFGLCAYNIAYDKLSLNLFRKFDFDKGFIYNSSSEDSDLHLSTGSIAIDNGHPPSNPLTSDYVDMLDHGGLGTSTADAGVYGGPYPFPDPVGTPILPTVISIKLDKTSIKAGEQLKLKVTGEIASFPGKADSAD